MKFLSEKKVVPKSEAFDYIVVGAGSAGAVVASRLSEEPGVSVVLLEAGGVMKHPLVRMPLAFSLAMRDPRFAWHYESEPEPALDGRKLFAIGGHGLGGTSSINGLVSARGHPRDYDRWREKGLEGWGYTDVLPYFRRLESHWRGEGMFHGASGPVVIEEVRHKDFLGTLYDVMEQSALAAGYPASSDLHGTDWEGVSRVELSVRKGQRSGTANAYLAPARSRRNLAIFTGCDVRKILIAERQAVGVEFLRDGRLEQLHCRKEVIVCAGAINSPRLLMLSGIGPAGHLRSVGIEPAIDLPGVGQNLCDHPLLMMSWKAAKETTLQRFLRWDRAAVSAIRWSLTKSGPMSFNGSYSNHYIRTRPNLDRPDVQIVGIAIGLDAKTWFPFITAPPVHRLGQMLYGLHPQSRGQITLKSAAPDCPPRILYNLLSDPSDMRTMLEACRATRSIYLTMPLAGLVSESVQPGPQAATDSDLSAFIRETIGPGLHPVGTCRMGVGKDAVVDAELRVKGIAGLRVADASVLPDLPGGNTNIPTIMVGEKAADLIRGRTLPPAILTSDGEANAVRGTTGGSVAVRRSDMMCGTTRN